MKRAFPRRAPEPAKQAVVIVGGGVMGCAAAFELARAGVAVTVLERAVPGAEASSAAAGILGAQVESHHPGPGTDLALLGRKRYRELVSEIEAISGISVGYRRSGVLKVAATARELSRIERALAWQKKHALGIERLSAATLAKREPALSRSLAGAIWFEDDATLDPPQLLAALRVAAEKSGARFRSGAFVKRVAIEEGRAIGVELDDRELVRGTHVVLAAGSWTALISPESGDAPRVVPARGQIVELKTSVPVLSSIVFGPDCYLVPRADGRLLIGSTLEFVGFQRGVTAGAVAKLLAAAIRLVPQLEGAELSRTWSSFRPYTSDELPLLGPSDIAGLIAMSGHYRNGILLAPISAQIVAACVTGKKPPLDLTPFLPSRRAISPS